MKHGGSQKRKITKPIGQRCVVGVVHFAFLRRGGGGGGSGGGGGGGGGDGSGCGGGGGRGISLDDPPLTDSSIFVFIEKV